MNPKPPANPTPPKKKEKKPYYVDPKEFQDELVAYYKTEPNSKPCDSLGIKILNIASRLSMSSNFHRYPYREDMVAIAYEKMVRALLNRRFNTELGVNPFSYFTKIAFNAFRASIKEEKKRLAGNKDYKQHLLTMQTGEEDRYLTRRRRRTIDDDGPEDDSSFDNSIKEEPSDDE